MQASAQLMIVARLTQEADGPLRNPRNMACTAAARTCLSCLRRAGGLGATWVCSSAVQGLLLHAPRTLTSTLKRAQLQHLFGREQSLRCRQQRAPCAYRCAVVQALNELAGQRAAASGSRVPCRAVNRQHAPVTGVCRP